MHRLRQARVLARLVLAWFVLAMGVAAASPLVQPGALQLVCSGLGAVKLVPAGDGGEPASAPSLDCPLCASVAPPPVLRAAPCASQAAQPPLAWAGSGDGARRPAAPLPARGPPSLTFLA